MLNKMSMLLAATAILAGAGAANADTYGHGDYNGRHNRDRGHSAIAIDFSNVAFGYRDGYWDGGHQWHRWHHDRDQRNYRSHGSNYHNWNHDRDNDNGWQRH